MITVSYDHEAGTIDVRGHAGAGSYGDDLVCAAASILAYTAQRALGNDGECRTKPGSAQIRAKRPQADAQILETVMEGYGWLEENYPNNLKVERRGKWTRR